MARSILRNVVTNRTVSLAGRAAANQCDRAGNHRPYHASPLFHQPSAPSLSPSPQLSQEKTPYHISYALDNLRLALLVPPTATISNGERRILSPVQACSAQALIFEGDGDKEIESPQDDIMSRFIDAVEKQYHMEDHAESTNNRVVGMGENDGGVWFAPYPQAIMPSMEPLLQWELIRGKKEQYRHAPCTVSFYIYCICKLTSLMTHF
jgi:hypothetical protein